MNEKKSNFKVSQLSGDLQLKNVEDHLSIAKIWHIGIVLTTLNIVMILAIVEEE